MPYGRLGQTLIKYVASWYYQRMTDALFDYLPTDKIIAAFERSPGNELASGKFASPESSAALAANTFGLFLDRPGDLPAVPGTEECGWPATYVAIEECAPFPWWPRGRHPWLDAFAETASHIIGIESKRYEPYRAKQTGKFSDAYWRPVWGDDMAPFERMRDCLASGEIKFERLDAVQLVKHAFGLRNEANRRGKLVALVYLYAEPETWPNGKKVSDGDKEVHALEAQRFQSEVAGAEVAFKVCTYKELLLALRKTSDAGLCNHADMVQQAFQP